MKKQILALVATIIVFASCKKETTSTPPTGCANTMAAIAGTYALVKVEFSNAGVFSDITATLEPCQVDDKIELLASGVANFKDMGTVCTPAGNKTGNWSIATNGKITISGGGSTDLSNADIVSFDCNTLVVMGTQSYLGTLIQVRLTIKK